MSAPRKRPQQNQESSLPATVQQPPHCYKRGWTWLLPLFLLVALASGCVRTDSSNNPLPPDQSVESSQSADNSDSKDNRDAEGPSLGVQSAPASRASTQESSNPSDLATTRNAPPATTQGGGMVYYVDPRQYSAQRAAFTKNARGEIKLGTVLLPAKFTDAEAASDPGASGYVGPQVCGDCHADYLESFKQTAHYRTSSLATRDNIQGSFEEGRNQLETRFPDLRFEMFQKAERYFQRLILTTSGEERGAEFPFDIVTGSGKVAQTYLYWKGEQLYQLHASFLTQSQEWVNSPGFEDGVANFARPIHAVCLECHATYFQPVDGTTNQFKKENAILGVTCERCHGPGAEHTEFHRQHPDTSEVKAIVNPSSLPAERSQEVCQICHGGLPTSLKQPPMSFRPGDRLADFYGYTTSKKVGIHTNSQLPRLKLSQCFQQSESMTCVDCHNPHQHESGDKPVFSQRCINCHTVEHCGEFPELGERIAENCVDCHMPEIELEDITFHSKQQLRSPTTHDHFIRVSEEATAAYKSSPAP